MTRIAEPHNAEGFQSVREAKTGRSRRRDALLLGWLELLRNTMAVVANGDAKFAMTLWSRQCEAIIWSIMTAHSKF